MRFNFTNEVKSSRGRTLKLMFVLTRQRRTGTRHILQWVLTKAVHCSFMSSVPHSHENGTA